MTWWPVIAVKGYWVSWWTLGGVALIAAIVLVRSRQGRTLLSWIRHETWWVLQCGAVLRAFFPATREEWHPRMGFHSVPDVGMTALQVAVLLGLGVWLYQKTPRVRGDDDGSNASA